MRAGVEPGRAPAPEFSRPVAIAGIGPEGMRVVLAAGAAERAALAKRFGLESLDRLQAEITVRPLHGARLYRAEGQFEAELVQACVATLEPVPARLSERIVLDFSDAPDEPSGADIDPEGEDPPEAVVNGTIDLGEAVAQQMALALDPYPRAPGAEAASGGGVAAADKPLAGLARLLGGCEGSS